MQARIRGLATACAVTLVPAFVATANAATCPGAASCPYTGVARIGAAALDRVHDGEDVAVDGSDVYVVDQQPGVAVYDVATGAFVRRLSGDGEQNGEINGVAGGIAVGGPSGNVYVAELNNASVQEYTPDGLFTTRWGGAAQGTGDGQFGNPQDVAVDSSGALYVTDQYYSGASGVVLRVVKRRTDGTTAWAQTVTGITEIGAIATSPDGAHVYDVEGNVLRVRNGADGSATGTLGDATPAGTLTGDENGISGVAVAGDGSVYVNADGRIRKFDGTTWSFVTAAGTPPGQVAVAGDGVYVETPIHGVVRYALSDGAFVRRYGALRPGELQTPEHAAVDADGNLFVADSAMNRVEKFAPDGSLAAAVGADGADGSAGTGNGEFNGPTGVAVDAAGNVWVADTYNDRVQELTSQGAYVQQWPMTDADGNPLAPNAIAVGADGGVWVAFVDNDIVREFTLAADGSQSTQHTLGTFNTPGTDGGQLGWPRGVAVDADNVYVADDYYQEGHNRIQKYSAADGHFIATIGSAGDGPGQFQSIRDVAVAGGKVWAVDSGRNLVQRFDGATGAFETAFGSQSFDGYCPGTFSFPQGIAAAASDVFVADSGLHSIERFRLAGGSIGSCDGTVASVAIGSPASSATVGGTPTIQGTASASPSASPVGVRIYATTTPTFERVVRTLSAPVGAGGAWSLTVSPALPDGTYTIEAAQTGLDGSGAVTSRRTITVSGSGATASPHASFSPASLDFGNVTVGQASAEKFITVTNTGDAPLKFSTFFDTSPFAWTTSGCYGPEIAPGASCKIGLTFKPRSAGAVSRETGMYSNAAESPIKVKLTGTGVDPIVGQLVKGGVTNVTQDSADVHFDYLAGSVCEMHVEEITPSGAVRHTELEPKPIVPTTIPAGKTGSRPFPCALGNSGITPQVSLTSALRYAWPLKNLDGGSKYRVTFFLFPLADLVNATAGGSPTLTSVAGALQTVVDFQTAAPPFDVDPVSIEPDYGGKTIVKDVPAKSQVQAWWETDPCWLNTHDITACAKKVRVAVIGRVRVVAKKGGNVRLQIPVSASAKRKLKRNHVRSLPARLVVTVKAPHAAAKTTRKSVLLHP